MYAPKKNTKVETQVKRSLQTCEGAINRGTGAKERPKKSDRKFDAARQTPF